MPCPVPNCRQFGNYTLIDILYGSIQWLIHGTELAPRYLQLLAEEPWITFEAQLPGSKNGKDDPPRAARRAFEDWVKAPLRHVNDAGA